MDNTSVPLSEIIPGHHQYNIIRALCLWTTPVFHHQGLYLDTISMTPSGRCTRGQHQYSITRACTCGHHQYSVIRALYPWTTSVFPSSGLVPGHHQYNTIRALHPWTTPVFHHQGLYLWTSSVFRHHGIVPMGNISPPSSGLIPVDNISIPSSGLIPGHHHYNISRALYLHDIISIPSSVHFTYGQHQ